MQNAINRVQRYEKMRKSKIIKKIIYNGIN